MSVSSTERLGKYFVIRCKVKPHLVLDIKNGVDRPGVGVVLQEFDESWVDHQLWFIDFSTGVIRNKLNNFCLDIKDENELIVQPYFSSAPNQQWSINGEKIQMGDNSKLVISVVDQPINVGSKCGTADYSEGEGQHWTLQHSPAQYFYIRSMHNLHKVMDVKGDSTKAGAKVIVYTDKGDLADNQLWYEDEEGLIRSKINGYILDGSGKKDVTVKPLDPSNPHHKWILSGSHIRCRGDPQRVLEYKLGGLILGNDCVVPAQFTHDQPLQNWTFDHVPVNTSALNHRGDGKFFIIRSRSSGLVLEVKEGNPGPGTPLVTAYPEKGAARQLFYADDVTGHVRSQLNNFCIDGESGQLVMNPSDPYSKLQQWRLTGHKVHSKEKHDLVWELSGTGSEPGMTVVTAAYTGSELQQWDKTHMPARSFYLVSKFNEKVIDVSGEVASTGASVIMYERKKEVAQNQLWYEDENGILRSRLNGYVIDTSNGRAKMQPFDPTNTHQYWIVVGDRLQNKYDNRLVLDIEGESKKNSAPVCAYRFMGADNQRWTLDFV